MRVCHAVMLSAAREVNARSSKDITIQYVSMVTYVRIYGYVCTYLWLRMYVSMVTYLRMVVILLLKHNGLGNFVRENLVKHLFFNSQSNIASRYTNIILCIT